MDEFYIHDNRDG